MNATGPSSQTTPESVKIDYIVRALLLNVRRIAGGRAPKIGFLHKEGEL